MKNLALITLILLFFMLFTSLTKMFSGNCFSPGLITNDKNEMNKPGCFIIYSFFSNPRECYCEHVQKRSLDGNLTFNLFPHSGKNFIKEAPGQNGKNENLYEFHNTTEATIGYFLIQ